MTNRLVENPLGNEHIDFGNSHAGLTVTEYKDGEGESSWLVLKVSTSSYGDHESSIEFTVNPKHAKELRKMAELLFMAANSLER